MDNKIAVLVVDDHSLFRRGVVQTINEQSDMMVIGEADSVESALNRAREALPDIALLDVKLPDGTGLDVALDQFNGRMVSEFPVDPFALPATVEHTTDNGGHRYRIQQSAGLRLEGGGPLFSISSLNGDVRIQKTQ